MTLAALHLQYSQSLPWVVALLGLLVPVILLTYRAQIRHISPVTRWILPSLRISAVLAIALSILRPVVTRGPVSLERAPIVILLDNSRSMGVVDSARAAAEWVGIAGALGKLRPETQDKQTQAIQVGCDRLTTSADDVVRARAELDYARLSGRGEPTAAARLNQAIADLQSAARSVSSKLSGSSRNASIERNLAYLSQLPVGVEKQAWLDRIPDRARAIANNAEQLRFSRDGVLFRTDQSVRDACQPLQKLSRLQLTEAVLFDSRAGLLRMLGSDTPVLGFGISDRVTSLPMSPGASNYQPLTADGSISNLTGGIRAVLDSLAASPPRAVVLFSDGRQTGAIPEVSTVAGHGVPIFTVDAASRSGIRDLSILNASIPSIATAGDAINLMVELRAQGLIGTTTTMSLSGAGPDEIRSVTFTDDRPVHVQFVCRFPTAGVAHLTLKLAEVAGEMSYDNNRIDRWVSIQPRPTTRSANPAKPIQAATPPSIETEMSELAGGDGSLGRLADATGGQLFRLDQMDPLAQRLRGVHHVNQTIEISLWDGPSLLAVVLGCLAAEWGLRKRYGLA